MCIERTIYDFNIFLIQKISTNTKYYRGVVAKKIKEAFAAGSVNMDNIERRIYLSFPTVDEHRGHPTTAEVQYD